MNHVSSHRVSSRRGQRVLAAWYDAKGGPPGPPHLDDKGNIIGPTRAGRFTMEKVTRHISAGRYPTSKIAWGTPLRDDGRTIWARIDGRWVDVHKVMGASRDLLIRAYEKYYNGDGRAPDKWIYNDFGHATLYYFHDTNHDGFRNPGEARMGDMFHPTPQSEAVAEKLRTKQALNPGVPLTPAERRYALFYSHGCIHVRPEDFDEMRARGYLAHGNLIIVHPYKESSMDPGAPNPSPGPPYELHFYPKTELIFVYGWQRFAYRPGG